jgi:hypothetical protein
VAEKSKSEAIADSLAVWASTAIVAATVAGAMALGEKRKQDRDEEFKASFGRSSVGGQNRKPRAKTKVGGKAKKGKRGSTN